MKRDSYIKRLNNIISLLGILIKTISEEQTVPLSTSQLNISKSEEQYVTSKEACAILKCSSVTLWKIRKRGQIKTYGYGVNLRFKKSEILNYLIK